MPPTESGFHPFQGRPLFGQAIAFLVTGDASYLFPSLSGKTSIRTNSRKRLQNQRCSQVSIPFREDLYSDEVLFYRGGQEAIFQFPSLSGKTSIRTTSGFTADQAMDAVVSIPFREELHSDFKDFISILKTAQNVSIPFREELHSDVNCERAYFLDLVPKFPSLSGKSSIRTERSQAVCQRYRTRSFHPFQGRAPFGLWMPKFCSIEFIIRFPSLSGKSSIRTVQARSVHATLCI